MAKPFCFTYSKLKSYETCGLQYQHQDILKTPGTEPQGDAIDYGNEVHKALEKALKGEEQLPQRLKYLQYWVDWGLGLPGEKFVEAKWALDRNRMETSYFGSPWYRLRADFAAADRATGLGQLVDWKTGNRLEEPLQLWLGAACMFEVIPELHTIDSMFVWLKEDDGKNSHECISAETIKRSQIPEIWDSLFQRIDDLENAVASNVFLPKPGRHCRWCRVPSCDFRGKAQ